MGDWRLLIGQELVKGSTHNLVFLDMDMLVRTWLIGAW